MDAQYREWDCMADEWMSICSCFWMLRANNSRHTNLRGFQRFHRPEDVWMDPLHSSLSALGFKDELLKLLTISKEWCHYPSPMRSPLRSQPVASEMSPVWYGR